MSTKLNRDEIQELVVTTTKTRKTMHTATRTSHYCPCCGTQAVWDFKGAMGDPDRMRFTACIHCVSVFSIVLCPDPNDYIHLVMNALTEKLAKEDESD